MDPHHHSDNLNLSIYAKANKQRIAMEDLKFTHITFMSEF